MDFPNAFIGRKTKPSTKDLASTLGSSLGCWNELIAWLSDKGLDCSAWLSVSPKLGWALRHALKQRDILYMAACKGCFRVAFVLGDRAVAAATSADLSADLLKQIDSARRYAEGTRVRLLVKSLKDLLPVKSSSKSNSQTDALAERQDAVMALRQSNRIAPGELFAGNGS